MSAEKFATRIIFSGYYSRGYFLCFLVYATCKQVYKIFQFYLFCYLSFNELISYVLLDLLFITSYYIHKKSSYSKVSVSIFVF